MNRRNLLRFAGLSLVLPVIAPLRALAASSGSKIDILTMQKRWHEFLSNDLAVVSAEPKIVRSAEQWKSQLPLEPYQVLFEEDTERSFTSPLNDEKRPGIFVCRACELPLFSSEMKYDSGTGWPSFFTAIPGHLATKTDYKMIWPRTEYHCVKCNGHQGHLFDDGPAPTGERWCNNGVALRFVPGTQAGNI